MAGRPAKFNTPEELQDSIDKYFDEVPISQYTITGLAIALGFCDRQSLYDYEEREEFSCIIKAARLRVENAYEIKLSSQNVTGSIFALKNMGWKDKSEVDNSHTFKNKPSIVLDFGSVEESYKGD